MSLLAIAGGAVASLPATGALTARHGSRPVARAAALLFCAVLPLPLLAPDFPLLLAAFVLLGIGIGALDVAMNVHAVLVEERYGRPIMSSFHGLFSLGGLVGATLAGGAMTVGPRPGAGPLMMPGYRDHTNTAFQHLFVICKCPGVGWSWATCLTRPKRDVPTGKARRPTCGRCPEMKENLP